MNNYFNYVPGSTVRSTITIKEERAPTDDSIRLLQEMEAKAAKSIIDKIIVEDNIVNGAIYIMEDHLANAKVIYIKFKLNGEEYSIKEIVPRHELIDKSKAVYKLLQKASNAILQKFVLKSNLKDMEE